MLSIVSGSLIDVLVPSFVSSSGADRKGISRLSSGISASSWMGSFIYLFLRKIGAGVAKDFEILVRTLVGADLASLFDSGMTGREACQELVLHHQFS